MFISYSAGSRSSKFEIFLTLIRVDFEIEFSKEQLSKIEKTDVDVATGERMIKINSTFEFSDNNHLFMIF